MDSNRPTTSDPQRTPLDQGGQPAAAEATVTREAAPTGKSVLREYVEAIVVAMLLAFAIRVFVVQAFKIPSGSMIPTLLIGRRRESVRPWTSAMLTAADCRATAAGWRFLPD